VQPGGLGIHLIRRAFTEVDYKLKKQGTELVLSKHFTPADDGCGASPTTD
jgi:anti-sigma regulatory factor (Ser/Thr protein kinase)